MLPSFTACSQLLNHFIFCLIAILEEIYSSFQVFVQLMYFHTLGGKSNILIFNFFLTVLGI
jgi:hypothetical protein